MELEPERSMSDPAVHRLRGSGAVLFDIVNKVASERPAGWMTTGDHV